MNVQGRSPKTTKFREWEEKDGQRRLWNSSRGYRRRTKRGGSPEGLHRKYFYNEDVIESTLKTTNRGVPVVAQWLMNQTRNHEVASSIPGLAEWVKDLALP